MIDKDLDIEIFRIEVRQKGNGLPRVFIYEKGQPIFAESIDFSARASEIPKVTITKPVFNGKEHIDFIYKEDNNG